MKKKESEVILDVIRKTVIKTEVTVQTSNGDAVIELFGKITNNTIRGIIRQTTKRRVELNDAQTPVDTDILNNNFIIVKYSTQSAMYEADVFEFLKIAKLIKRIH